MYIKFDFNTMMEWYKTHKDNKAVLEIDSGVHGWVFERNDELKRFSKSKNLTPFVLKTITYIRKISTLSAKYSKEFPEGLYCILYKPNWIMFMYPRRKFNNVTQTPFPYMYADHFSAPYEKNNKKQVHFHRTTYVPEDASNGDIGMCYHLEDHFADDSVVSLTSNSEDCILKKIPGYEREAALDMLKLYARSDTQEAGGKRAASPEETPAVSKRLRKNPDIDVSRSRVRNLQHIVLFSIKQAGVHYVTATVDDGTVTAQCFSFLMKRLDTRTVLRHIKRWLNEL